LGEREGENFCPPALPREARLWGGKRLVFASAKRQSPQKFFTLPIKPVKNLYNKAIVDNG
jgi:hypothetical protein